LNELRESRKFWRTVAKDELLSADIIWDIYLRASHVYAEIHAALAQAETVLKQARTFKHDHTTIMARMEQASRKRYLQCDQEEQEQCARRPAKPECSSGSESDKDCEQHDGVVYVLTKKPRGDTFSVPIILVPGFNLIAQSQAGSWATAGLLAGPAVLAGIPSGRKQAASSGYIGGSILRSGCRKTAE
jgi:hypothetical protein